MIMEINGDLKMFKQEFYDKIYRNKAYLKEVRSIKRFLKKGSILDVGGGTGMRAKILENYFDMTILDPDKKAIEIAKKKGIRVINDKIESDKLSKKKYDNIIMMFNVFCFLDNPEIAINNIYKKLKKSGVLIFDYWDYDKRKKGFSIKIDGLLTRISYKKWFNDICHIHFWFPFKMFHEKHKIKVYPNEMIEKLIADFKIVKIIKGKYETTIIVKK
jgi:SAM-dependent methyltransferase